MITPIENVSPAGETNINRLKITLFHCAKALNDAMPLCRNDIVLKDVKLACSSMVKDIYLLKAFEAGADAVIVLTCPEGQCQYIEGNLRARKRVERVKKLLDEIGWGGERLLFFNIGRGDEAAAAKTMEEIVSRLNNS